MATKNLIRENTTIAKPQKQNDPKDEGLKKAAAVGAGIALGVGGAGLVNSILGTKPEDSVNLTAENAGSASDPVQGQNEAEQTEIHDNAETADVTEDGSAIEMIAHPDEMPATETEAVADGMNQEAVDNTNTQDNTGSDTTDIDEEQQRPNDDPDSQTNNDSHETDPAAPIEGETEQPSPAPETPPDPKYDEDFNYSEIDDIPGTTPFHVVDIAYIDTVRDEDGDLAIVAIMEDNEGNTFYFADINGDGTFNEQVNPYTGELLGEAHFELTLGDLELLHDRAGGYLDPVIAQIEHGPGASAEELLANVVNTDPGQPDGPLLADNQTGHDEDNSLAQNEDLSEDDIFEQLFGENDDDESVYDEDIFDQLFSDDELAENDAADDGHYSGHEASDNPDDDGPADEIDAEPEQNDDDGSLADDEAPLSDLDTDSDYDGTPVD